MSPVSRGHRDENTPELRSTSKYNGSGVPTQLKNMYQDAGIMNGGVQFAGISRSSKMRESSGPMSPGHDDDH